MENSQPMTPKIQLQPQENTSTSSLSQRRAFMRLSLEERRQVLQIQAKEMCKHYQKNTEWQELEASDIIDY